MKISNKAIQQSRGFTSACHPKTPLTRFRLQASAANCVGFTLVELLVVVSIISILATIGLVSFGAAQMKARDSQRKADLKTIQQSLELYYGSQSTAAYPTTEETLSVLSPNYLKVIPQDPSSSNPPYCYSSNSITFNLYANLENSSDPSINSADASCGDQTYTNGYKVENP